MINAYIILQSSFYSKINLAPSLALIAQTHHICAINELPQHSGRNQPLAPSTGNIKSDEENYIPDKIRPAPNNEKYVQSFNYVKKSVSPTNIFAFNTGLPAGAHKLFTLYAAKI